MAATTSESPHPKGVRISLFRQLLSDPWSPRLMAASFRYPSVAVCTNAWIAPLI